MCLAALIDLPIEQINPAIAATWRTVYPLAATANPELSPDGEAVAVGGSINRGDA